MATERTTASATVPWDAGQGERLAKARAHHGHDQKACIDRLVQLGGRSVSQSTLSKREKGAVSRLYEETTRAIARYCDDAHLDLASQVDMALTNEPLLSDRQARIVDGLATRLIQGPSMTDAEVRLAQVLLKGVGL